MSGALRLAIAALIAAALQGCDERAGQMSMAIEGGDAERGRQAIRRYGCDTCHTIPGIVGADATVGPPLVAFADQVYIAGVLPNLPEELVRWIVDPPAVDPRTAMPDLDVSDADARDIGAYLYSETK